MVPRIALICGVLVASGLLILGTYWAAQWLIASALPVRR